MLYRSIRKIDTGEWVNVLFTVDGDTFSVPAASHLQDIARTLKLHPDTLEVVDGESDPRVGTLVELPVPLARPPTRTDDLLAIASANWTDDELRELVGIIAKRGG